MQLEFHISEDSQLRQEHHTRQTVKRCGGLSLSPSSSTSVKHSLADTVRNAHDATSRKYFPQQERVCNTCCEATLWYAF